MADTDDRGRPDAATPSKPPEPPFEQYYTDAFARVQAEEIASINEWRKANGRPAIKTEAAGIDHAEAGLQAVAISGGGIRSASFALGVLQALDQELAKNAEGQPVATLKSGLGRIDYLSTVSGGGYIGASLRVGMEKLDGAFPFTTGPDDRADNQSVGHIRDHSRYLIPNGLWDVLADLVVVLRGLAANLILVLGFVLLCAALTILCNPTQTALATPDIFGIEHFPGYRIVQQLGGFALTKLLVMAGVALFCAWAIMKSRKEASLPEFSGGSACWNRGMVAWLIITALVAFIEFQPFVLSAIFEAYGGGKSNSLFFSGLAGFVTHVSPFLASLSVCAAFFSKLLGDAAKAGETEAGLKAVAQAIIATLAMAAIALALPLLIWASYLTITIWGDLWFDYGPEWLKGFKTWACGGWPPVGDKEGGLVARTCAHGTLMGWIYFAGACLSLALGYLLTPNANSLHRLYRDRLSKAFLFDPSPGKRKPLLDEEVFLPPLDSIKLSDLTPGQGPLHLINAALNIQGSRYANRRGRNADFFSFSPVYCGSKGTGYVATRALESVERGLDVATAMAISGAAASSNMGSNTVRGLAPTLALLNIRLGFWMRNPRNFITVKDPRAVELRNFYFLNEMLSQLNEGSEQIYLTDGGHIENLGLYELLRRRCALIVVIDGESDPTYTFNSFVNLQRYARIDLGIRITLPWQAIRDGARWLDASLRGKDPGPSPDERVHVAVGTIRYQDDDASKAFTGRIIYIKASMTGDENDYVMDYKRRYAQFPHETTGDQFFSEEQLEAYRSLGFHAARRALVGLDPVAGPVPAPATAAGKASRLPLKALFT